MKKPAFYSIALILFAINTYSDAQTFYGLTSAGGSYKKGALFKCTASGTIDTVVSFDSINGATPFGNLIQVSNGDLYGMTNKGGAYGLGTLFKCSLSGILTTLVNFNAPNGAKPEGSLIQATDGNLYGMTAFGGSSDSGTIFKCTLTGTLTTLLNLNRLTGAMPRGNLIQATDGNLYGMMYTGGTLGEGVLFRYNIVSNTYKVLFNFDGTNHGSFPHGSLIQAYDGNLYGMTTAGGTQYGGVLFRSTLAGSLTKLYDFDGTGIMGPGDPYGKLVQATDSNLYGLTYSGPDFTYGTLIKYYVSNGTLKFFTFGGCPGPAAPLGSLIQGSDGYLYGMTYGGSACAGLVLKSDLSGSSSVLNWFNGFNEGYPHGDLLEVTITGINETDNISDGIQLYPVPVKDNLFVTINSPDFLPKTVDVYDVMGRKIIEQNINPYSRKISLNVSSLESGIYILKLQGKNDIRISHFIVD